MEVFMIEDLKSMLGMFLMLLIVLPFVLGGNDGLS